MTGRVSMLIVWKWIQNGDTCQSDTRYLGLTKLEASGIHGMLKVDIVRLDLSADCCPSVSA